MREAAPNGSTERSPEEADFPVGGGPGTWCGFLEALIAIEAHEAQAKGHEGSGSSAIVCTSAQDSATVLSVAAGLEPADSVFGGRQGAGEGGREDGLQERGHRRTRAGAATSPCRQQRSAANGHDTSSASQAQQPRTTSDASTAAACTTTLFGGGAAEGDPQTVARATLLLLGGGNETGEGPPAKLAVASLTAAGTIDGVLRFRDVKSPLPNRLCMLDLRFTGQSTARRLCVSGLSPRVTVNGTPAGDKWQPLAEGDSLGLGHRDSDARAVYAVTYTETPAAHRDAMAIAFARDVLACYGVDVPLDALDEAGVGEILCPAPQGEPSAARLKRARDELLAVSRVSQAIVNGARSRFVAWAKDEAVAHGVAFGSHTQRALERVGVAIARCYEASGFAVPPASYWAEEGFVKCREVLRAEERHTGELDLAAARLRELLLAEAAGHSAGFDDAVADHLVQYLLEEFEEERAIDPETGLEQLASRVWSDFGRSFVRSFCPDDVEWAGFHLDVRARLVALSRRPNFAEELDGFLRSLRASRRECLALDIFNHALALALAKRSAAAVEAVLAQLRAQRSVDVGTFHAWLLEARRSRSWHSIADLAQRMAETNDHVRFLTQALADQANIAEKSVKPSQAATPDVVLERQPCLDEHISIDDDGMGHDLFEEVEGETCGDDEEGEEEDLEWDDQAVYGEDDADYVNAGDERPAGEDEVDEQPATLTRGEMLKRYWVCCMAKELPSQLTCPHVVSAIEKRVAAAAGMEGTNGFCFLWRHATIFDTVPILGFDSAVCARQALRSPDLCDLGLEVCSALATRAAKADSGPKRKSTDAPDASEEIPSRLAKRSKSRSSCRTSEQCSEAEAWNHGCEDWRRVAPVKPWAQHGWDAKARSSRSRSSAASEDEYVECAPLRGPHAAIDQDGILVVYKPAFWTVTTSWDQSSRAPKIQQWLTKELGGLYPFLLSSPRAGCIHRLDVQTSGPVLVATRPDTFSEMKRNLHKGCWYKEYVALMHGTVPPGKSCGVLDYKLLTRHSHGCARTEVNNKRGKPAETRYQAIGAYRCRMLESSVTRRYTLVHLHIVTGRTHQIRVHLAEFARQLGLPVRGIVGDYKYLPIGQVQEDKRICNRVFLHAQTLKFPTPGSMKKKQLRVNCPLPPELQRTLSRLEKDERTTHEFLKNGNFLHDHIGTSPPPCWKSGGRVACGGRVWAR